MIIKVFFSGHNQKGRFYIADKESTVFCEEFNVQKGKKYFVAITKAREWGNKKYYEADAVSLTELEEETKEIIEKGGEDKINIHLQKYLDDQILSFQSKITLLESRIEELEKINGILTPKEREEKIEKGEMLNFGNITTTEKIEFNTGRWIEKDKTDPSYDAEDPFGNMKFVG